MKDADVRKYLDYARTPEAYAVLFVKKYLDRADSRFWIDILNCDAPAGYDYEHLMFKSVTCELFPRKHVPVYPPRRAFQSEHDYVTTCRALTWEAATGDIAILRRHGYHGAKYRIDGVSFPKHKSRLHLEPPDPATFFVDGAPPEIKALANNLSDRTDPLWDKAMRYVRGAAPYNMPDNDGGYEFRIRRVTRL